MENQWVKSPVRVGQVGILYWGPYISGPLPQPAFCDPTCSSVCFDGLLESRLRGWARGHPAQPNSFFCLQCQALQANTRPTRNSRRQQTGTLLGVDGMVPHFWVTLVHLVTGRVSTRKRDLLWVPLAWLTSGEQRNSQCWSNHFSYLAYPQNSGVSASC